MKIITIHADNDGKLYIQQADTTIQTMMNKKEALNILERAVLLLNGSGDIKSNRL